MTDSDWETAVPSGAGGDECAAEPAGEEGVLAGIRVLDLTRLLPGPMCSLHLADMGADVIKVEDTARGDYMRDMAPLKNTVSPMYLAVNRNKRSLALDLKSQEGRAIFLRLARTADVVIEGFRPGVTERLGIGHDVIKRVNPRMVYCSITGYGQTGPYRNKAGHDINYCAIAGILDQNGPLGGAPVVPNFQIGDLLGGAMTAAMGILAALVGRQRTGKGRYIDVSMTDAVLAHTVSALWAMEAFGGTCPRGQSLLSGGVPCYGVYPTRDDRHLAVGALEAKFWRLLCETIGRKDLIDKQLVRGHDADAVREDLSRVFRARTQAEWVALFKDVDCCVTPVLRPEEALANEQVSARDMVIETEVEGEGTVRQFAPPLAFDDDDFSIRRVAPIHGAHTDEILSEIGFGEADLAGLEMKGAIRRPAPIEAVATSAEGGQDDRRSAAG